MRKMRAGRPIPRESDQRYWRRRANRKVRKARLARTAVRWAALTLAHLAIGGVLLFAGVRIFLQVTTTKEFALQRIEVDGTHRAPADSIRDRLAPFMGRNLLDLNLHEVGRLASRDPWVENASAKRILPDTLRVTVTELRPAAIAVIQGVAHIVDTHGYVIGASGSGVADDLPVLTGLDGLEEQRLVAALKTGVGMIEHLRRIAPGWIAGVSELDLSRPDRVAVRTIDPGPTILLDPYRVERNLAEYLELRRDIGRRVGAMEELVLAKQSKHGLGEIGACFVGAADDFW